MTMESNAATLKAELKWLERCLAARFEGYGDPSLRAKSLPAPPSLAKRSGSYAGHAAPLDKAGRLILILAVAPNLAPEVLDPFLLQNQATGRRFTEFGGVTARWHAGFLPTVETAFFLLGGSDLRRRLTLLATFHDHPLIRSGMIQADPIDPAEPATAAPLRITAEGLRELLAE